jgi:DNA-directed RNA polymerase specialized sigma24 family protein
MEPLDAGTGSRAEAGAGDRAADGAAGGTGDRLAAQAARLRLLLRHLAGPALRERVDLDDLVQETFLRVLAAPRGLPQAAIAGLPRATQGALPDAARSGVPPATSAGDADLWRLLVHVARHVVVDVARAARAAKRGGLAGGPHGDSPGGVRRTSDDALARSGATPSGAATLSRAAWSRVGPGASRIAADTAGPATRAMGHELGTRLEAAFATLSAEHRRVLGLRQLQGLSAEDAGARMGRSASAVHSLYRRALLAWEQALAGDDAQRASRALPSGPP